MVIAPTQAALDALDHYYGPLCGGRVVPVGRDPGAFSAERKEPLILTSGRLGDEAANVHALERVAPRIAWPIYVAGEQETGGAIRPDHMVMLGSLSPTESAGWLGRASIFALPARYEPIGLSLLEAGLSRCALVLGDTPNLRQMWGDAALYTPPDDPDALYATLERLIADDALRSALADHAWKRALRFSPHRMADAYRSAYADLRQTVPTRTRLYLAGAA